MADANEEIWIVKYNPEWVQKFKKEQALLQQTLGPWITEGIEHVGSTSVPGLDAKPIIDIQVGVNNLEKAKECIPLLERIGYCYAPYRPYMHWFCKPSPAHREFHLQLMEPSHPQWKARMLFRNYLREHPDTAREYAEFKKTLALKFPQDREAYTESKTEFVEKILSKVKNKK